MGRLLLIAICEDSDTNPGVAMLFSIQDITENLWDLTNGSSTNIIPLLDPNTNPAQNIDDFMVSYHLTEQDAEDGINGLSAGYEATNGEILYIRVENIETGCFNTNAIGQVQIIVEPRPNIIGNNPDDLFVCADDLDNPTIATIDLTEQDGIINPGEPINTQVIYYDGMDNYNNNIPINNPANFQTAQTPQNIIAEVINTQTLCESSRFVDFDIFVRPLPNVDISVYDGTVICFDENGNLINNDISPPLIDTGLSTSNYSFAWSFNGASLPDTSPSINAMLAGTYSVSVTDINTGCVSTSSATIVENNPPVFEVTVLTPSFSQSHVVEVSNIQGNGDYEFQLDDGEWISLAPGQTTVVFTNVTAGAHIIRGRDRAGCGLEAERFSIIGFPPFFTPNQDGFNETWNITGLSEQPNAKIYIFDRYGKLLKQLSPQGQGWNGFYKGRKMPSQDYWFRVEFIEPNTGNPSVFKSHFTLKR